MEQSSRWPASAAGRKVLIGDLWSRRILQSSHTGGRLPHWNACLKPLVALGYPPNGAGDELGMNSRWTAPAMRRSTPRIEALFPIWRSRRKWRRQLWKHLANREHQRLILFVVSREASASPGAVRNHWRRIRLDATLSYNRLWGPWAPALSKRHLTEQDLLEIRKKFVGARVK